MAQNVNVVWVKALILFNNKFCIHFNFIQFRFVNFVYIVYANIKLKELIMTGRREGNFKDDENLRDAKPFCGILH